MFGRNKDDDDAQDDDEPTEPAVTPEQTTSEPSGPDPAELDVRIDELEDEIDSTESTVRAIRSSQEEMTESMEEMHETVRRLTGVYDRLVADENPFVERDEPSRSASAANESDPEPETADEPNPETADESADDVVSFDDLYDESAGDDEEMSDGPLDDYAPEEAPEPPGPESALAVERSASREPMLSAVPEGYAGDVLVMEWLAALMERSGPAGALRAVEHYEQTGWISESVKERLVSVIGGPSLDVFVDPMQAREPTAHEHTTSHQYLTVLGELDDI